MCEWVRAQDYHTCVNDVCLEYLTYVNKSCLQTDTWMSYVLRVNESMTISHMWTSHVLCEWVMSHVNESCHTCECVFLSHIRMGHVTHVNESCHTWDIPLFHNRCTASRRWMSHVSLKIESRHTCEWVMSHLALIHGTPLGEWVCVCVCVCVVTHLNESCHTGTFPCFSTASLWQRADESCLT